MSNTAVDDFAGWPCDPFKEKVDNAPPPLQVRNSVSHAVLFIIFIIVAIVYSVFSIIELVAVPIVINEAPSNKGDVRELEFAVYTGGVFTPSIPSVPQLFIAPQQNVPCAQTGGDNTEVQVLRKSIDDATEVDKTKTFCYYGDQSGDVAGGIGNPQGMGVVAFFTPTCNSVTTSDPSFDPCLVQVRVRIKDTKGDGDETALTVYLRPFEYIEVEVRLTEHEQYNWLRPAIGAVSNRGKILSSQGKIPGLDVLGTSVPLGSVPAMVRFVPQTTVTVQSLRIASWIGAVFGFITGAYALFKSGALSLDRSILNRSAAVHDAKGDQVGQIDDSGTSSDSSATTSSS